MTEARDIDEIVADWEHNMRLQEGTTTVLAVWHSEARALIADWRAKKTEIKLLKEQVVDTEGLNSEGIEIMRAKCEAIAQDEARQGWTAAQRVADAIAALKP